MRGRGRIGSVDVPRGENPVCVGVPHHESSPRAAMYFDDEAECCVTVAVTDFVIQ